MIPNGDDLYICSCQGKNPECCLCGGSAARSRSRDARRRKAKRSDRPACLYIKPPSRDQSKAVQRKPKKKKRRKKGLKDSRPIRRCHCSTCQKDVPLEDGPASDARCPHCEAMLGNRGGFDSWISSGVTIGQLSRIFRLDWTTVREIGIRRGLHGASSWKPTTRIRNAGVLDTLLRKLSHRGRR